MLKILFKQPWHIFQSLRLRHKLELFFLLITVGAVLTLKAGRILSETIAIHPQASPAGLVILLLNSQLILLGFGVFFILAHLLERQQGLRVFNSHPLGKKHIFYLYGYYAFKYSVLNWLLTIVLSLALLKTHPVFTALAHLFLVLFAGLLICALLILLRIQMQSLRKFYIWGLTGLASYFIIMGAAYVYSPWYLYFQAGLLLLLCAVATALYKAGPSQLINAKKPNNPDMVFSYQKQYVNRIPRLFSPTVQALLEKELKALWRNHLYRRAKLKLLIVYLLALIALLIILPEYAAPAIGVLTSLALWSHFSSGFNEKYMPGDSEWFIRTQPIRFHHYFTARYLAESPFLWALNLLAGAALMISNGLSGAEGLAAFIFILLFGQLLLAVMLNFQALFHDDVRLAGYAFHFSVLFGIIMVFNYRLVGPAIIFILLIFYFYKTHQYFSE